jgi:hypothetical protein
MKRNHDILEIAGELCRKPEEVYQFREPRFAPHRIETSRFRNDCLNRISVRTFHGDTMERFKYATSLFAPYPFVVIEEIMRCWGRNNRVDPDVSSIPSIYFADPPTLGRIILRWEKTLGPYSPCGLILGQHPNGVVLRKPFQLSFHRKCPDTALQFFGPREYFHGSGRSNPDLPTSNDCCRGRCSAPYRFDEGDGRVEHKDRFNHTRQLRYPPSVVAALTRAETLCQCVNVSAPSGIWKWCW